MPKFSSFFHAPWPWYWRVLATLALYAAYLPLSGYGPGQFRFDAAEYWELSLKFTPPGGFSLLAFDEPLRGYLGPLLVLPARLLCHFTGWSMLTGARVLGAGWAELLFGVAIPELWARTTGRAISGGRWLALLGLGFVFWRDYFNFTLSDMPALALLLLGLAALGRRGWLWAGAAGLLLAASINIRPIYVACLPGVLWLLADNGRFVSRRQFAKSLAAVVAGAALVLLPQLLINQRHFNQSSPLVLAQRPGKEPLYLRQLAWGTAFQRYETSLVPGIPRSLVYADSVGQRAVAAVPGGRFGSYGEFLQFLAQQPFSSTARYARHLFNGLDVRYPTPYPTRLHPPGQAALRLLNYALLGLGIWLAWARWQTSRAQPLVVEAFVAIAPGAVLLALLLPCLLVLPTLMECRFLLPLHLLLLTGIAATWQPLAWWRSLGGPMRQLAVLALAAGWLWGCWQLSEATAGQLRPPSEAPQ
ncbi:hypothetical protein MON38_00620 [Hymenobacter sp. DH14]|uniref:Uncharacterized protein n=1 Tax=Hymenobacter cyanobacteriorum TaxID=2926463 RepID=A0A9X2AGK8_9BACT|nr:hypothetical protein [Hymenobacter cyanobacteriorum]MCI1185904.1 hypothetical protein [Hymenobacter cyanobacteriorum]